MDKDLLLYHYPNRVWTKEQLFRQLWYMDDLDGDVFTIVVHVGRVRDKLKKGNYQNCQLRQFGEVDIVLIVENLP